MNLIDKILQKIAQGVLIDIYADEATFEKRITICNGCENLTEKRTCKLCDCYVDGKARALTHFDIKAKKHIITYCEAFNWDEENDREAKRLNGIS